MKKRDAKRRAILDAAYRLFRTKGFDATSVSEINAEVGGSKATIYSHFPSKEELFVECMTDTAESFFDALTSQAASNLEFSKVEPRVVLHEFGLRFLSFLCSPDIVDIQRLMVAEAHRFGIGKLFYSKLTVLRKHVEALMSELMALGVLRAEEPRLVAEHFRGLLQSEILEPLLLQVRTDTPDQKEIASAAERAVSAFLRAYGS